MFVASLDDMSGCGSESGRNDGGQGAPRGGPGSTHSGGTDLGCTSPGQSDNESVKSLGNIKSINDIPRKVGVSWSGALILKNSSFPTRLYLTEGDFDGIELLMKDEECKNHLRITQRLRLDQVSKPELHLVSSILSIFLISMNLVHSCRANWTTC